MRDGGSPKRQSQIEEAMTRLDRAIDGLTGVPAKFEERLQGIMRQQDAEKTPQINAALGEMVVPLANRINACADTISKVVSALNEQGNRLEL